MRILLLVLVSLATIAAHVDRTCGQDAFAAAPPIHLRSHRNQALLGPFRFADGARIRVGDEDYTVELPKRPGKLTHKGKTRFFRNISGLLPVSSSRRFAGAFADELALAINHREFVIPWDKVARIEIGEGKKPNYTFYFCKVTPPEGKEEVFEQPQCFVEFEWIDSIARERCSLIDMVGGVIELGPLPTKAEQE